MAMGQEKAMRPNSDPNRHDTPAAVRNELRRNAKRRGAKPSHTRNPRSIGANEAVTKSAEATGSRSSPPVRSTLTRIAFRGMMDAYRFFFEHVLMDSTLKSKRCHNFAGDVLEQQEKPLAMSIIFR